MEHWTGTSGFQYAEWKGTFYPAALPSARMLHYYAENFATTEINYSFRRIPSPKTLARWAEETGSAFKFSFKAPQTVTHFARLKDCGDVMEYFARVLSGLGTKLGPVLFQLPPNFAKDAPTLRSFLEVLPPGLKCAFEFRHPSWFDEEISMLLRENEAALCIADSENMETPFTATASFGYLRLRREDYTPEQIRAWARRVQAQADTWKRVFIYFKHEERAVGPKFASQMMEALNAPP